MSQAANPLLRNTFQPAAASRRWIVTPVCISILAHLLLLSSIESLGLFKSEPIAQEVGLLIPIDVGTVNPDDIVGIAMAPDLEEDDFHAVSDTQSLVARLFPDYRDSGPREAPGLKPAPRYPEEELPLVANAGLSGRSQAFVRDGELGETDPGTSYWEVETDRGQREFVVQNVAENARWLSENRLLLIDVDGNRFEIPRLDQLDKKSSSLVGQVL